MLSKSDKSIAETINTFNSKKLEVSFLVPTKTGLNKSIMDAHGSLREFLKKNSFHDYDKQKKGPENKVTKNAYFLFLDRVEKTQVSLYRPITKNGDPRIWFYGFNKYSKVNNLIAIFIVNKDMYLLNCSSKYFERNFQDNNSILSKLLSKKTNINNSTVKELFEKLVDIHNKNFVKTFRAGDTGVGFTLESLLGIKANSNRTPDYKGIEIKSFRKRKRNNKYTLFSKAPDWNISPIKNAKNLLNDYGYKGKDGNLRISHTISTKNINSIGFKLEFDDKNKKLKQTYNSQNSEHLISWDINTLKERLKKKHDETFWVSANSRGEGINEEFHYTEVEYTSRPNLYYFDLLLESGSITVDYNLKFDSQKRIRDHGYLFKIQDKDKSALFSNSQFLNLSNH